MEGDPQWLPVHDRSSILVFQSCPGLEIVHFCSGTLLFYLCCTTITVMSESSQYLADVRGIMSQISPPKTPSYKQRAESSSRPRESQSRPIQMLTWPPPLCMQDACLIIRTTPTACARVNARTRAPEPGQTIQVVTERKACQSSPEIRFLSFRYR